LPEGGHAFSVRSHRSSPSRQTKPLPDAIEARVAAQGLERRLQQPFGSSHPSEVVVGDIARIGEHVRCAPRVDAGDDLIVADLVTIGRGSALGDSVRTDAAAVLDANVTIGDVPLTYVGRRNLRRISVSRGSPWRIASSG
jgi:hypothetical protein